jgi:PAS domain S-box-containing protein
LSALSPQNPFLKSEEIYHMPSGERHWVQWIDRGIYDRDGRLVEIQSEGRDITELKLTEEALEKSEKRYQAIVNDQVEMVGRFRPDGTLIFANPALAANLGLSRRELEGKNLFEILPDEVALPLAEDLKSLSPDNPCIFREHEYKTPSGEIRWERWSDLGIFNERGELVEIQGVGRDMTELKRSRDAQEHLNAVLKSIRGINRLINKQKDKRRLVQGICAHLIETRGYGNVWVALLEKRGNLATVTEAGINEQGRPMAETLEHEELNEWGRNVLKTPGVIVSRHTSPRRDCPLLDNFSEKAIMTTRLEHGGTVYGLLSVSLPEGFSADGEERTLFLEVAGDIAFALHAIDTDKDREKAVQQLREKAREIEILMKDRPEGLWAWDRESDRVFFNENYEKNLGYEPGEIQPSRSRWEKSVHPDDLERVKSVLESCNEGPGTGDVIEFEYRIRTKQGEWKWVTDRGHIVERDENGKALWISGTQTAGDMASLEVPFRESCRTLVDALCRDPSRGVILHWDTDVPDPGRIFAADRTACRLTGFPAKELTGKKLADLLEPFDEGEGPSGDSSGYRTVIRKKNGKPLILKSETIRFRLLGRGAGATFLITQEQPEGKVLSNKTD